MSLPFCNSSLLIRTRVKDLITRLTLREKIGLLGDNAVAVPRLGINAYKWWSEALHGVSNLGPGTRFGGKIPAATSFPQVITTAASFNRCLWEEIGRVVSDEARAMYNDGIAGLTFWSPNVNIFRDPRWGRGQETPGEDPNHVSNYAVSYVKGLQDHHSDQLKVASCCKHYTAYDLDKWNGSNRHTFNAQVSLQDLEDTYNVPFKKCVREGKVACIMCSYNQVNGRPTCADPKLLRETIRGDWNLSGYIVSDCDSVADIYYQQHYTRAPEDAAAQTIKAGLDLDCGSFLGKFTENAITKNILTVEDVNGALTNTLTVQMRLGMYNGDPTNQLYGNLVAADVCSKDHQTLAYEAAVQGIVLLENRNKTLPLSSSKQLSIAVIGPNANATVTMIGNYHGVPCKYITPLQGIVDYAKTTFVPGCNNVACRDNRQFDNAVRAARKADATILVMGLDQSIEAEGLDRTDLLLPGYQQELIQDVANSAKGPVVLVLMCGGPVDVSFAVNNSRISAILWVGYPGEAGGEAIADILFGKRNPGGKLPMTWYPNSYLAKVPMTNMNMRANKSTGYPGRTHKFYRGLVVYKYGYGLSYSNCRHSFVRAPKALTISSSSLYVSMSTNTSTNYIRVSDTNCDKLSFGLHINVINNGTFDGSHTILLFAKPPKDAAKGSPRKQLVGFEKVHVAARSQQEVKVTVDVCECLSIVDELGTRVLPMGEHKLLIGDLKHAITLQTSLD